MLPSMQPGPIARKASVVGRRTLLLLALAGTRLQAGLMLCASDGRLAAAPACRNGASHSAAWAPFLPTATRTERNSPAPGALPFAARVHCSAADGGSSSSLPPRSATRAFHTAEENARARCRCVHITEPAVDRGLPRPPTGGLEPFARSWSAAPASGLGARCTATWDHDGDNARARERLGIRPQRRRKRPAAPPPTPTDCCPDLLPPSIPAPLQLPWWRRGPWPPAPPAPAAARPLRRCAAPLRRRQRPAPLRPAWAAVRCSARALR